LSHSPGSARVTSQYRIVDALIASDVSLSYAWKDVTHVPRRLLPARALVLALSPLLDARGIAALLDLRARGYTIPEGERAIAAPIYGSALLLTAEQRASTRTRAPLPFP
jgi:hypothetical protein